MADPTPSAAPVSTVVPLAPGATPAVVVISKDQPANGIIRIVLRANDDPASDSHATFYVQNGLHLDSAGKTIPATTAADIQAWVAQEKARVASEYAAMSLAHNTLLAAIGS